MNETECENFLSEYNRELLSYEEVVERLSPEIIKTSWLGYAGATEEEIAAAEKRLATKLPPSFRAFLKASNGWRFPSVSIFDLLPVSKLSWFQEQNQDWIDAYTDDEPPPVSDKEYFVYGDKQDCVNFRREYLQTAMQISGLGDSAVVLLNPKIVTPEGEWETWFFANWLPGAQRYRSFDEWLVAERATCCKQLKTLPKAQAKKIATSRKPRSVRKALEAVWNGQIEVAIEALESFAVKGDHYAISALSQLYAFRGEWDKVIANASQAITSNECSTDTLIILCKLLVATGRRSGDWNHVNEAAAIALKANANHTFDQYHEYIRVAHDKILRNLITYAQRQGAPPHEFFWVNPPEKFPNLSQVQREAKYQNAVRIADSIPFLKTPHDRAEHVFKLMRDVWDDKAIELYETHGANFLMGWEAAEYVARLYVQRKNPEAAWAAIASNFRKFSGYLPPIILLTDEHLSTLMTPERCRVVLSTPRGPEASKK